MKNKYIAKMGWEIRPNVFHWDISGSFLTRASADRWVDKNTQLNIYTVYLVEETNKKEREFV